MTVMINGLGLRKRSGDTHTLSLWFFYLGNNLVDYGVLFAAPVTG